MSAQPIISVSGLTKAYDGTLALDGIGFDVARGSVTALLGGNGAGKTTTLSVLLGLLLPTSGTVRVLGADMTQDAHRVLGKMNFSSPYVDLPRRLSARENLTVYGHLYGLSGLKTRLAEASAALDLSAFLDRPIATLSAGQRTRVALAKALLNEPELLLLDEPTASLDPDTGDRMRSHLEAYRARTGATIVLASHNMLEVERMCDRVLMMRGGRIVDDGTPAQLVGKYGRATLEEVFLDVARGVGAGGAA